MSNVTTLELPFEYFLQADFVLRANMAQVSNNPAARANAKIFTVAWALLMVPDNDHYAARLVMAAGLCPHDVQERALLDWDATIRSLHDWRAYGLGGGFVSFLFNAQAFFRTLLQHDAATLSWMEFQFRKQADALFPKQNPLPFPDAGQTSKESVA